jgi:DNA repair protein RAD5
MQREQQGRSRQEMDEQLQLLGELALSESSAATQHGASINDMDRTNNNNNDIVCHIGSVLVSEKARQLSQTLDGQVNPICHPLWQQRFLASQGMDRTITFYVNELLKTATHRPPLPPTPCSGGILADAMGLGKTVMLLALIMKEKEERTATTNRTTTLIVAKLSLLPQWQDEIQSKTNLTCRVYYGPTAKSARSEDFANCDVVITTYGSIQCEEKRKNPALLNFQWLRVILDEAHCIKNQATLASKVCCRLDASHRWCVSGTIIQNSLDDVYGIMKFLRHEPWCTSSFWKAAITNPMNAGKDADAADNQTQRDCMNTALGRVRRLLSPIMIRRTKDSKTTNGDPILTLPPVETKIIKVDLTETEREFYNAVLARSLEIFGDFVDAGTAGRSYIQIFAMLTKLRQVCDHVALTVRRRIEDDNVPAEDSNEAAEETADFPKKPAAKVPDALGQDFYNNLLEKLIQSPPRKTKRDREEDECLSSASKRHKDHTYLTQVATSLSEAMKENCTHVDDECPICLGISSARSVLLDICATVLRKAKRKMS